MNIAHQVKVLLSFPLGQLLFFLTVCSVIFTAICYYLGNKKTDLNSIRWLKRFNISFYIAIVFVLALCYVLFYGIKSSETPAIVYQGEHLTPKNLGQFFIILAFASALFSTISYFLATINTNKFELKWLWMGRIGYFVNSISVVGIGTCFVLYYLQSSF